jgi:flavin-binding protein dodecin
MPEPALTAEALAGRLLIRGEIAPTHPTRETTMSIAKNVEITASSKSSFEDAIREGIKRISKTVDNVEGAWVKEQKIVVKGGNVTEYRVNLVVTFVLKDEGKKKSNRKKKT